MQKCEAEVQSIRHLKFVILHFPGRPRVRVRLLDGHAGETDERRIWQGTAQVAGEAVGHLAGLFIHLAAKPILAAVRFIRAAQPRSPARRQFTGRELRPAPERIAQLPDLSADLSAKGSATAEALAKEDPFEGGVFDDGFVEAHGFGGLGFLGFGSFFKSFVACSNSVSTGRGSLAVSALNLSYSNSALAWAISCEMRPA